MRYPNLDRLVQLHEDVVITYVVDAYEAEFNTHDGNTPLVSGYGPTIDDALTELDKALEGWTLEKVRACR